MQETIYYILLYAHISAGTAGLILGLLALSGKKGQLLHKTAGKGYVFAMLTVCVSGFSISLMKDNSFLLSISIFTFYMVFTGWRSIHNKLYEAQWYDWVLCVVGAATGIWMVSRLEIVQMVFGSIVSIMSVQDTILYYRSRLVVPKRLTWLNMHIGRMTGSYIAAATAFLVVNVHIEPYWVTWLLPTVLGSVAMAYFLRV